MDMIKCTPILCAAAKKYHRQLDQETSCPDSPTGAGRGGKSIDNCKTETGVQMGLA